MPLLIDPPILTYASAEEVEDWIAELARKRERYATDPSALESINLCMADAQEALARKLRGRLDHDSDLHDALELAVRAIHEAARSLQGMARLRNAASAHDRDSASR